jgi:L-fuconolactonase
VRIADSHCHVSPVWYEPVDALIEQMDRNGVAQAVLVQLLGELDNAYLLDCVRDHPGRFACVVAVDPARPDACDTLARLADDGAAGVRLRPDARSPGPDPLAIWRAAATAGLAVSCAGTAARFASRDFGALIDSLPDLPVVLEHLGGTSRAEAEDIEARRRAFDIARFPNVYVKVPGLGELVSRPSSFAEIGTALAPPPDVLYEALERFGAERLMWGSDFPVVSSREGYSNALGWAREAFAGQTGNTLAEIFGGAARRVFRLS